MKRIAAFIVLSSLFVTLSFSFVAHAAGSYSPNGYYVTANITSDLKCSHSVSISGTASGSARCYYTYNGQSYNVSVPGYGAPGSGYWAAHKTLSDGRIYKATTE